MQVIFYGILLVHPKTVITELPETQTGFFFEPIMTCPMAPFFPLQFCCPFFRQVICLWSISMFNLSGHNSGCCSQSLVLSYIRIVRHAQLGK